MDLPVSSLRFLVIIALVNLASARWSSEEMEDCSYNMAPCSSDNECCSKICYQMKSGKGVCHYDESVKNIGSVPRPIYARQPRRDSSEEEKRYKKQAKKEGKKDKSDDKKSKKNSEEKKDSSKKPIKVNYGNSGEHINIAATVPANPIRGVTNFIGSNRFTQPPVSMTERSTQSIALSGGLALDKNVNVPGSGMRIPSIQHQQTVVDGSIKSDSLVNTPSVYFRDPTIHLQPAVMDNSRPSNQPNMNLNSYFDTRNPNLQTNPSISNIVRPNVHPGAGMGLPGVDHVNSNIHPAVIANLMASSQHNSQIPAIDLTNPNMMLHPSVVGNMAATGQTNQNLNTPFTDQQIKSNSQIHPALMNLLNAIGDQSRAAADLAVSNGRIPVSVPSGNFHGRNPSNIMNVNTNMNLPPHLIAVRPDLNRPIHSHEDFDFHNSNNNARRPIALPGYRPIQGGLENSLPISSVPGLAIINDAGQFGYRTTTSPPIFLVQTNRPIKKKDKKRGKKDKKKGKKKYKNSSSGSSSEEHYTYYLMKNVHNNRQF